MKHIREHAVFLLALVILLILTGIVFVVGAANANPIYTVRTVYFQPKGSPNPTEHISGIMLETQGFYRSELENHGYVPRAFQLETDNTGNPIIHTIKGQHPAIHYISDTYNTVEKELPFDFKRVSPIGQNNIHVIFVAGLNHVDTNFLGVGYPFSQFHSGGNAVVAGNRATVSLVAHELGHGFGLFHTGRIGALMGSGSDFLLDYEARWLDNHHFFNDQHIKNDFPETTLDFPIQAIGGGTIRFRVAARSESGLYHAQLCRSRGTYILGYDDTLAGNTDIIQVDASRGRLINGDNVWLQIMDVNGNYYFHHIRNIRIPEPNKDAKTNKNPIVQVPKNEPENEVKEVDEIADCPDCEPELAPIERNLNVASKRILTTQWAALKSR